ncbi:MAG: SGNH/GDSL hydrolase family protein [Acidimicrobiales bacterium]
MKRLLAGAIALLMMMTVVATSPAGASDDSRSFYVSLGDSLAAGIQPDENGDNQITDEAYTDVLFNLTRGRFDDLSHVKLGCPGETTVTMIKGGICSYDAGSQLDAARVFIEEHPDQIAFITINLGANDLLVCDPADPGLEVCVATQFNQVAKSLGFSLATLREVAPGVPIVGMNYYNPNLAAWLSPGGPVGEAIAIQTTELNEAFNDNVLEPVYGAFGVPIADVTGYYLTSNFLEIGGTPLNVSVICRLTWMCDPERGPNIHANRAGYRVIAIAFYAKMLREDII